MQAVTIRPAEPADIPEMARLWYDKMVLQQQFDRRFALPSNGQARWMASTADWLHNRNCAIYVAANHDSLIGYVVAWLQPGPPGLSPERIGVVSDLTIDAHGQHGGTGRLLLQPVREWLTKEGVSHIVAHVPRRQAVEQAFWRALGATEWLDSLWMKL
jgi:L-amino acid N-acyltransferase YncA